VIWVPGDLGPVGPNAPKVIALGAFGPIGFERGNKKSLDALVQAIERHHNGSRFLKTVVASQASTLVFHCDLVLGRVRHAAMALQIGRPFFHAVSPIDHLKLAVFRFPDANSGHRVLYLRIGGVFMLTIGLPKVVIVLGAFGSVGPKSPPVGEWDGWFWFKVGTRFGAQIKCRPKREHASRRESRLPSRSGCRCCGTGRRGPTGTPPSPMGAWWGGAL